MRPIPKFAPLVIAKAIAIVALTACGGGGGDEGSDTETGTDTDTDISTSTSTDSGSFSAVKAMAVNQSLSGSNAAASGTWVPLVIEGQNFNVTGTQTIRYGAGSSWIERTLTGLGVCSNSFFGSDPLWRTLKTCQLWVPTPPVNASSSWSPVAFEGGTYITNGTQTIRYGTGSTWTQRTFNGSVACNNDFFGTDPIFGTAKVCQVLLTNQTSGSTSAPPPPPPPSGSTSPGLGVLPPNPKPHAGSGSFNVTTASGPGPRANDIGAFRTVCDVSHFAFDDPIVYPGQPGRSHLHMFMGNTATDAFSTASSIANSGNSTCAGGIANRSSYWVPAVIDTANSQPVMPTQVVFYYKTGYNGVTPSSVRPLPPGLRMIAGDPNNRTSASYDSPYKWVCHNNWRQNAQTIVHDCAVGDLLDMVITFPQCWDGVNLDSPDHKSHMAYPRNGGCPGSHPVPLVEISYHISFAITRPNQTVNWRLSSDTYSGPAGLSMHADWFNGWDRGIAETWTRHCSNASRDCHAYLLGDGRSLF